MIKSVYPNWPAPSNIHALTTTRAGGVSQGMYSSLNLAAHVNDNLADVQINRSRLIITESIPTSPNWLQQTHSTKVVNLSRLTQYGTIDADGSYTDRANLVSVVLTADCLPVLFCSRLGNEVAAAHAGWRGLCDGILEQTVKKFTCKTVDILVWLGPAIGPQKFEVGEEVKAQFEAIDSYASEAFMLVNSSQKKYLADLYLLAKQRLAMSGVTNVYGGDYCTYSQNDLFYSYRREKLTGRMASIIWFE